ncbi:hypothetical protein NMG60_11014707 [Bertholletia excelsa]
MNQIICSLRIKKSTLQSHWKGLVKGEPKTLASKSNEGMWEGDNSSITSDMSGKTESFSPSKAKGFYKRPKQTTTKVSTAHVRIDPSDGSLVSSQTCLITNIMVVIDF